MVVLTHHQLREADSPRNIFPTHWNLAHLELLRVVTSASPQLLLPPIPNASVLVQPKPPPPDDDPQLRRYFYSSSDEPERYILPRDRQFWCFAAGVSLLYKLLDSSTSADRSLRGIFTESALPSSDAERPVELSFGSSRLTLHPQGLVRCQCAAGEMPVLAILCDSERLAASDIHRRHLRPKDMRRQNRLNSWDYNGTSVRPTAGAQPPPPYGLAMLIGMAQMQYQLCSRLSNPPKEYQVYLVVASKDEGCTVHEFYSAHFSASTLAAVVNPDEPYWDNIAVRRFAINVGRRTEYLDMLHRILEPWAVRAKRELLPLSNGAQMQVTAGVGDATAVEAAAAEVTAAEATVVGAAESPGTVAKAANAEETTTRVTVAETILVEALVAESQAGIASVAGTSSGRERKKRKRHGPAPSAARDKERKRRRMHAGQQQVSTF